jgi:hypothetical protein
LSHGNLSTLSVASQILWGKFGPLRETSRRLRGRRVADPTSMRIYFDVHNQNIFGKDSFSLLSAIKWQKFCVTYS